MEKLLEKILSSFMVIFFCDVFYVYVYYICG